MSQILPLSISPNQTLSAALVVNGAALNLNLNISFNRVGGFWAMDIADQNGVPIVSSVPFITGDWPAANILGAYEYLQIGSWFLINQNGATTDFPDDTNLGSGFVLLVDDNNS